MIICAVYYERRGKREKRKKGRSQQAELLPRRIADVQSSYFFPFYFLFFLL